MIREGSDPVVVHSSIALLQERFKQLQRMKEMRQERQLLKLLAAAEDKAFAPLTPPQLYDPASPLGSAATSVPQLSISLWPIQPHSWCLDSLSVPKCFWLMEKEKQIKTHFSLIKQSKYKDLAHLDELDTSLHL